ncbi:MAG TPA: FAD-binding oxidoreductase [Bryobacteraceae bacterium]|jgi:glycolate oxidase FAD binding subunit|nr:FAD-binding oxidoreductase [Bryobacteraceae bacterium]
MAERFRPASRTEADGIGEVLRAIVGPEHVRMATDADAVAGVIPLVVVEPGDERQIASVLRCANQAGLAVIPCGSGTKLDCGNPPAKADVILTTRRLNRVIEHAWADLTVTVEAGCTIAELQRTLAQHGQRLAVDPLWPERATIGGILSTNDSGALRLAFGALRDLIIGVTLALADGTIASSGGRVVKNVAGYDLPKLATGSLGTLGVITRAVFRLHPLPRNTRTLTIAVKDGSEMQRVVLAILGAPLAPVAVQVRNENVDILLEGTLDGIAAQEAAIKAFGVVREGSPEVWKAREELFGNGLVVKFTTLPARLSAAAAAFSHFVIQGTGIGYAQIPLVHEGEIEGLRAKLERDGGSLMILGISKLDAWGSPGDALPLMRAVKEQFDPKGTLNPGRFVGGI